MSGRMKQLLEEFYSNSGDGAGLEELQRAQEARRQQTAGERFSAQMGSASDALAAGLSRRAAPQARAMPAMPDPMGEHRERQALTSGARQQRMTAAKGLDDIDAADATKATAAKARESLTAYLVSRGQTPEEAAVMAGNPRILQAWQDGQARAEDRTFRAGESAATRAHQSREGALNRANARDLAGQRAESREAADAGKKGAASNKDSDSLRGQFEREPVVKAYRDSSISFDKMKGAVADPSAAGDLALIFSYMKVLDPGSTVREGEFATAQNAAGVDGRVVSQYNKIISGERLNPSQRQDFLRRAGELHAAHQRAYQEAARQYEGIAQDRGLRSGDVVRGAASPAPRPAATGGSVDLAGGGTVRMRNPEDGATYNVDSAEADDAAANGWERL